MANARVVAKFRDHADVLRSWCSSNDWISICCALDVVRIVAKPCRVAAVCVNTRRRAGMELGGRVAIIMQPHNRKTNTGSEFAMD